MSENLQLPLAQVAVNRDYLRRQDPKLFDSLWADPETKVLVLNQDRVLLSSSQKNTILFLPPEQVSTAQLRVYLGLANVTESGIESPIVLAVLSDNAANNLQPNRDYWHQLRRTGTGLTEVEAVLVAAALALANWHESHTFGASCGSVTVVE
ncbi:MAG: hypothetical protein RL670_86, partial [Actinomycetota bacterium]